MKLIIKRFVVFGLSVLMIINSTAFTFASSILTDVTVSTSPVVIRESIIKNFDSTFHVQETDKYILVCEYKSISKSNDEQGSNSALYEINANAFVPLDNRDISIIYDDIIKNRGNFSLTGTIADKNGCAQFSMTVNYTKTLKDDDFEYIDLTTITGGFYDAGTTGSYVGENVYVTSQYIDVGQNGLPYSGQGINNQNATVSFPNGNRAWSYLTPSSWVAIRSWGMPTIIGATYYFTLARGNSSWTTNLPIWIINN